MGLCSSSEDGVGGERNLTAVAEEKPSDGSSEVQKAYKLTTKQHKLVDEFYERFDRDKDGAIAMESIAKLNTSPREEIAKLFGMTENALDKMEKGGMIRIFEQANAAFASEAGKDNAIAFVTEMLTVLLKVTKGELSEEEGNKYLASKSSEYNIQSTDAVPNGSKRS
mmetsp:Transcript_12104/g.16900  ORF Transcript_12104/g.16900 Transcript_12104/m.16900 type:complete len:167 (+) Transcript_12104:144-644(+)|eukprot:CAMPEP_0184488700 /NCGR_PEP_ID=MMETSP0113_2-20130426/13092_1 /TAXON_ID=91329 /ORGANISM="Norrisiella sphaerica, Strain BC52" /LENGTH=166 /DNA_ID=CAMNT_0026871663 /DNA_START=76 /DNA_END=576 /DNA_ORIENTATION=+